MIKLYTWGTPNGRKISIMLEEVGLPYQAVPVDISKGEQFKPDFLQINPNNKIPAIVDEDTGQSIFESGAILLYLAEKTGKLLPDNANDKWQVMQWLMWQMAGQGPMLGQAHHFLQFNPGKSAYAEERYLQEAKRLYDLFNTKADEWLKGKFAKDCTECGSCEELCTQQLPIREHLANVAEFFGEK